MTGLWGAKCREVKTPAVVHLVSPGTHAVRAVVLKSFQNSDAPRALRPATDFRRQDINHPACLQDNQILGDDA